MKDKKPIISGVYAVKYRDWYYIGCSNNIHLRFATHKSKLRNGKHHCKAFQNHYKQFGGEVELIILLETDIERLTYDENDFIIDYRRAGFNVYNIYPSQWPLIKYSTDEAFNKDMTPYIYMSEARTERSPLTPMKRKLEDFDFTIVSAKSSLHLVFRSYPLLFIATRIRPCFSVS